MLAQLEQQKKRVKFDASKYGKQDIKPLNLDTFEAGTVFTYSASSLITDSAAGATAA